MQYDILVSEYNAVDFNPDTIAHEVIQNVRTILATPKFSVPLFREFGLENGLIDTPINEATAKLKSDIIMAVRKFEPRADITYLELLPDNEGRLFARIRLFIQEGDVS